MPSITRSFIKSAFFVAAMASLLICAAMAVFALMGYPLAATSGSTD
ncbi:MAG: hypothetical protein KDJ65_08095 [Anaerolineae bacterium]|nr:hypothetical protein [Anaerolineae bacterium]